MRVTRLREEAILPTRGSTNAAAFDLYVPDEIIIKGNDTTKIPIGIAVEIPRGMFGMLKERSSLAVRGLHATAGIIDSDYRGEIQLLMRNTDPIDYVFKAGERIGQIILMNHYRGDVVETDELSATDRGDGGFGSTGK